MVEGSVSVNEAPFFGASISEYSSSSPSSDLISRHGDGGPFRSGSLPVWPISIIIRSWESYFGAR